MIPNLSFPPEKIKLTPLYLNQPELEKARNSSEAGGSLSKVDAAYHELYFPAPQEDRPYIFASMVLSMDGKMAFPDNPQGPVVASANAMDLQGALADFWVLNVLRAHADAIVTGARTLKAEAEVFYTCLDPDLLPDRREKLGKTKEHPITIIVSLDGTDIPISHSLFSIPELQTVIATSSKGGRFLHEGYGEEVLLVGPYHTPEEVDGEQVSRQVEDGRRQGRKVVLMTGEDAPDAPLLLYILRKMGIKHLEIESPTYTWLLMSQKLLDEFFLTYSSLFIGGPFTPGSGSGFSYLNHPHTQLLVVAMHRSSFLFTRQKLVYGVG